eukprot:gene3168-3446_t
MTTWRDADGLRRQLAVVWSKNNNGQQRAADALAKAAQDVGGVKLLRKIQTAIANNITVDTWLIDNAVVALEKLKQLPNTTEIRNARTTVTTALIGEDVNNLSLGNAVMERLQINRKLLKQAKENRLAVMGDKEGCSWAAPSRAATRKVPASHIHLMTGFYDNDKVSRMSACQRDANYGERKHGKGNGVPKRFMNVSQAEAFAMMKEEFPFINSDHFKNMKDILKDNRHVAIAMDFAENYTILEPYEVQTQYFSNRQVGSRRTMVFCNFFESGHGKGPWDGAGVLEDVRQAAADAGVFAAPLAYGDIVTASGHYHPPAVIEPAKDPPSCWIAVRPPKGDTCYNFWIMWVVAVHEKEMQSGQRLVRFSGYFLELHRPPELEADTVLCQTPGSVYTLEKRKERVEVDTVVYCCFTPRLLSQSMPGSNQQQLFTLDKDEYHQAMLGVSMRHAVYNRQ